MFAQHREAAFWWKMNFRLIGLFKRQTALNLMTAVGAFAVGILIRFFTAPYIVRQLGVEAYGFVGVSANILGLTSLLTIAINSLAGRFIAIEYQAGNREGAKSYYSSVFLTNLVLAAFIGAICGAVCWKLDYFIHIPSALVSDVKTLFAILTGNTIIALVASVWGVGAFIRNRVDTSNCISFFGNLIYALMLVALFGLGSAHIWYVGAAILSMGVFVAAANLVTMRRVTPDLSLEISHFDQARVLTLAKSGLWNLVSKLSDLLGQGFDLLIANLFIGASLTGVLAIAKNIPFLLLGLFSAIATAFAPMLVRRYAEGSHSQFIAVLERAIRVSGLVSVPIFVCLFVFGKEFYGLWMPGQDASFLQTLTLLGVANMVFAMPLEELWTVFSVVNKLKWPTLFMLANSLLVFATMITGCLLLESVENKLMVIAGSRAAWGVVRSLTFLPIYGAASVCVRRSSFYSPILRNLVAFAVSLAIGMAIKRILPVDTWLLLVVACLVVSACSLAVGSVFWQWELLRKFLPVLRRGKPMIHFVYRRDMANGGDMASCPRQYFRWPLRCREHDIDDMDLRWIRESDIVILGGGGLLDCTEEWNRTINKLLARCRTVIAWSVGFNGRTGNAISEKIDFGKFSMLSIRDKDHPSGYEWLPCVSALAIEDTSVGAPDGGIGTISHRDHLITRSGACILNSESPRRVLEFIRQHGRIETNSYHAAYWAGLLNREVVLRMAVHSEKFKWLSRVDLADAKEMNCKYYRRVMGKIAS